MGTITVYDALLGEYQQQSCYGCGATGVAIETCKCGSEWCYGCIEEHKIPRPNLSIDFRERKIDYCPDCRKQ